MRAYGEATRAEEVFPQLCTLINHTPLTLALALTLTLTRRVGTEIVHSGLAVEGVVRARVGVRVRVRVRVRVSSG